MPSSILGKAEDLRGTVSLSISTQTLAFFRVFRVECEPIRLQHCLNEPRHKKTNKMECASSDDSDQPGHPLSLIKVLAIHKVHSAEEGAQADPSLRWAH